MKLRVASADAFDALRGPAVLTAACASLLSDVVCVIVRFIDLEHLLGESVMNHKILTAFERKRIKAYLENGRGDGARDVSIRQLVYLGRKCLPDIEADLALLKQLLQTYRGKQ